LAVGAVIATAGFSAARQSESIVWTRNGAPILKYAAVRVGRVDNVAMPDRETTFDDLQARISATVSFLGAVPPTTFERQADTELVVQLPGGQRVFTGRSYLLGFALPNFFFHITTAYDLLRHLGVPIGKRDFLGWRCG
jgi:uncharacterized protein